MSEPVVHRRAPIPPKQVTFPSRRHITRSGASRNPPTKLKKRQSTLTQLDFVSTPHGSREVEDSVSSEGEEEHAEPAPKRRKKLGRKRRDQSTLTQNWRRGARDRQQRQQGNSDGEPTDWKDDTTMIDNVHQNQAQDTQGTAKYLYGRVQEQKVSHDIQEVAGDAQSAASPAVLQHQMLVASSDAGVESTRPSTAESKAEVNPKTPKRVRRTEVPSSQTPSSAKLSVHRSRKGREYEPSPLRSRSCCTPVPLKKSPRSQPSSPSQRMPKHVISDVLRLNSLASANVQSEPWKSEIATSPRPKQMPTPGKRQLIRTTIVQDSQDYLGLVESSPGHPRRVLKWTSTVSDSEAGSDLDDLAEDDGASEHEQHAEVRTAVNQTRLDVSQPPKTAPGTRYIGDEMSTSVVEGDEVSLTYDYTASLQQQTFDPVSAALDRDAARFGRGPTQLHTQHHSYMFSNESDVEDDPATYEDAKEDGNANVVMCKERVEDSEPEFVAESPMEADPETQFVADSPHAESQCQPSPELDNLMRAPQKASSGGTIDVAPIREVYARSMWAVPDAEGLELPMPVSPNPLNPSQVSTVASTQQTASRPNSGHGNPPTSPQKSTAWPNTLSSSPFPQPPESWLASQSYRGVETQSSGILDFSLPPPPPLISSARETPASSSR